jgi:ferredoxin
VRKSEDFIFGQMARELAERFDGYDLREHLSGTSGRLTPSDLDEMVPDWTEREAFLSGPGELLDAMLERWEAEGDPERLHIERFQPVIGEEEVGGEGGTIRFRVTDFDAKAEAGQPILVAGEEAGGNLPYGCRMGICHTCVGRLCVGRLRDLRTGEVHGEEGQMVRTCVNAPEGHVEIDL